MKTRSGFVSNSSSSSFVIKKYYLSPHQIEQIHNHSYLGKKMGIEYANTDPWSITENEDTISGHTYMDNFDMGEFLRNIFAADNVEWSEY